MANLYTLTGREIRAMSIGELHAILFKMDTSVFFDAGRVKKHRALRDKVIAALERQNA